MRINMYTPTKCTCRPYIYIGHMHLRTRAPNPLRRVQAASGVHAFTQVVIVCCLGATYVSWVQLGARADTKDGSEQAYIPIPIGAGRHQHGPDPVELCTASFEEHGAKRIANPPRVLIHPLPDAILRAMPGTYQVLVREQGTNRLCGVQFHRWMHHYGFNPCHAIFRR